MNEKRLSKSDGVSRRRVLQAGGVGVAAMAAGPALRAAEAKAGPSGKRPNLLLILCDQMGLDAVAALGYADAKTPNLDRLVGGGTTFMESHSTNPVCSPARSSIMTGRMPVETGVVTNGRPIHKSCPNLGQWLGAKGYETVYCGKWHLPGGYQPKIEGFTVLPAGQGQGDLSDTAVSNACTAWIKSHAVRSDPFLMVASFMQPHDICYWGNARANRMPENLPLPFERLRDKLPQLPPNHKSRPKAPKQLAARFVDYYTEDMWRYYLYIYARQIEMLDADVGRLLDALEATEQADDTVIIFTSDHGDGRGRHSHVSKWYPYEEAVKVPMIVSAPGRVAAGRKDTTHFVSGVDVMPTMCDYASIAPPENCRGLSLRPLLEGKKPPAWRDYVVADYMAAGRLVRSPKYKYVWYRDDPVEMLFDMQADPWETKNLYQDPKLADVLAQHRKMLAEFEATLTPVAPTAGPAKPPRRAKPGRAQR